MPSVSTSVTLFAVPVVDHGHGGLDGHHSGARQLHPSVGVLLLAMQIDET